MGLVLHLQSGRERGLVWYGAAMGRVRWDRRGEFGSDELVHVKGGVVSSGHNEDR